MFDIFLKNINKKAFRNACLWTLGVIVLTLVGSVNLQNYDAALIIYFFGTIAMTFGLAYRHTIWLQRPPTRKYWDRTWEYVFSKDFWTYTREMGKLSFKNILLQKFIFPR